MMKRCFELLILLLALGCMEKEKEITWHGHRGCRGLMPENTIEGFLKTLEYPVDALEMDIVITGDRKVLVSHEPYMSSKICLNPDGSKISDEFAHNIFQMTFEQVQAYDCGSLALEKFPGQKKLHAIKPALSQVFDVIESKTSAKGQKVLYNIEAKSKEGYDDIYHPGPKEYAKLLVDLISKYQLEERVIIQSFDFRVLRAIQELNDRLMISMLVDNKLSPEENLSQLGFIPQYYSPKYTLVEKQTRIFCDLHGMRLSVWTVNEIDDMKRMISLGVDDIITDYPNLISEVQD